MDSSVGRKAVDERSAQLERRGMGMAPVLEEEGPSVEEMMGYLGCLLEHAAPRPWSLFHRGAKGCRGIESKSAKTMVLLAGGGEHAERIIHLELANAAVNFAPHLMEAITSLKAVVRGADEEFRALTASFELQAERAEKAEAAVVAVLEALGADVELSMPHLDAKELGDHVAQLREEVLRAETGGGARRPWYVWELEAPEEGGCIYDAASADEARRLYEESAERPEEVGPEEDWIGARPVTADDIDKFMERDVETARLRDALKVIAAPMTARDFGNGWATRLAQDALRQPARLTEVKEAPQGADYYTELKGVLARGLAARELTEEEAVREAASFYGALLIVGAEMRGGLPPEIVEGVVQLTVALVAKGREAPDA